jgi:methyl-accepting chemotaxis protein
MELNVRSMIRANAALFTVALIGEVVLVIGLTRPIWIKQPLFDRIIAHKDLINDMSPPPLILNGLRGEVGRTILAVEADAHEAKGKARAVDRLSVAQLQEYYRTVRSDYEEMQRYWSENPNISPQLRSQIREQTAKSDTNYLTPIGNQLIPALQRGDVARAIEIDRELDRAYQQHLNEIQDLAKQAAAAVRAKEEDAVTSQTTSLLLVLISSLALLGLAYYLLYRMQRASVVPLGEIAGELSEGSEQFIGATSNVASASQEIAAGATQVAGASQRMAAGASEQAAAIEETSASLEQMSSMIHSSARNADLAKTLAGEAQASATMGNESMEAMGRAMDAIEKSSNEVAKIVKSIDEIAFQTNILALNAAVEAARAGEAGAGFAVVAEEVRSLAQRSAAAAHESSDKIEASILRSREGADCLKRVNSSFAQIGEKVEKTDSLVSEITLAAKEQAQGIEHITAAIQEMSRVAQDSLTTIEQMRKSAEQSAANVQRIASSSEQMRSQAVKQQQITAQLRHVVDGSPIEAQAVPQSPPRHESTHSPVRLEQHDMDLSKRNLDAHFSDY